MPDYEAMFLSTAQETAELMSKRGKQPRTWDCDGQSVRGWAIDTDHSASKDGGEGWWEEYWSNTAYILTTDGTFWEYRSSTSKYSHQAAEQSATLRPLDTSYFVGREGKPFGRWKSKLERLPYL